VSDVLNIQEREAARWKARLAVLRALEELGGWTKRRELTERTLLLAGFTERELAASPPPEAAAKHESFVNYTLGWTLTNLKRERLLENPGWSVWTLTRAAQTPVTMAGGSRAEERLAELRAMSYEHYLQTPEWQATRAEVLARSDDHCALEETHTEHLDVHHISLERLGAEEPRDLVVLCRACHQLHHAEHGRPPRPHHAERPRPSRAARRRSAPSPSPRPMTGAASAARAGWLLRVLSR
jgi:hypothetical protein